MNKIKKSQIIFSIKIISASGIINIMLLIILALVEYNESSKTASFNEASYQHLFSLSNAVLEASADILAMQGYMRDIALTTNRNELDVAIALFEQRDNQVYEKVRLIEEVFRGDEEGINEANIGPVSWHPIRDEVMALKFDGQHQMAAVFLKREGDAYLELLNRKIFDLNNVYRSVSFEVKENGQRSFGVRNVYIYAVLILLLLSGGAAIIFFIILVRTAESDRDEAEGRFKRFVKASELSINKNENKLKLANDELYFQGEEKAKRAAELALANKEKGKRSDELALANKEKGKRADELILANEEKGKRADELILANEEKGKRADELILANEEKGKRADELILANEEKGKRADELALANKEKGKRADELALANKEKGKRADELILANEERGKRANELALAASVFTHAHEGIIITDASATIIDVNDTFTHITGFSREEVIGQNPRILQSGQQSPDFYVCMWQALLKDDHWSGEVWNRRKSGEVYAEKIAISAVRDSDGIITHYVGLGTDITPMKAYQDKLEQIAHYDVLTHLPNRSLLADRLSHAMLQTRRHENSLAVVFLDLDGFKAVNDAHGHNVGDELLIALAAHMKEALREGDTLARIGGDEFVAVLADLAGFEDSEPVLDRLLLAASQPVAVGDVVFKVSASIGVTLYPQDNVEADLLMRHADQAMYVAKESGKNRYHLFDTVQDDALKAHQDSLEAIRSALDNHQFVLYYQPKVNMRTGHVMGVEALVRWQHSERGLLDPIEFLPCIENNPMNLELGEWVIDTALTQISRWQGMKLSLPLCISVNLAAINLQQPDFTERLAVLLAAHPDVDPSYLELEVLETSALDDVQHVSGVMDACIALGVSFSLDDFGTGYSSLTHLRRLPAHLIKIDQSFVRDMLVDAEDLAIVEGVIALSKSFKREVIAEGVETIEHGAALLQLGCEAGQGYGIARPMPASDIPEWISGWKPDISWKPE